MDGTEAAASDTIPAYLVEPPLIRNKLTTPTSILEDQTILKCIPLLNGLSNPTSTIYSPFDYSSDGVLSLQVESHVSFLEDSLSSYPAPFVAVDASRPWLIYWGLLALHFLKQDISIYRDRVVKTFTPLQNHTGGYGGGEGHLSHLACTYAAVLSLALVGGEMAWKLSDRTAMWHWLGRLKQADGGFKICEGGEEDVRGAYCAMVAITLLDLPWELPPDALARSHGLTSFGTGLEEYLSRCQTYEGGISASPGTEAHGAYTFCALACLCFLDRPDVALTSCLDLDALVAWLSSRQYAPEGGLAGRTNKLVDGCYSQWLGGCWPIVLAALNGPQTDVSRNSVGNLYSTEGLARYILNCCQQESGGLRDKPGMRPDSYHSCYTLAGLSTTQHYHYFTPSSPAERFSSAFSWQSVRHEDRFQDLSTEFAESISDGFNSECTVNAVHPVFVIPHSQVMNMRRWAVAQDAIGHTAGFHRDLP